MIAGAIPCHESNFNRGRGAEIRFLVLHYTGNNGDTAKGNCVYFSGGKRGASAHFFVDEYYIYQSVKEEDTAWHCGTTSGYKHPACRNKNSIGIELCSRVDAAGNYYIKAETVANAVRLAKHLMAKYSIPVGRILRHYDITGKRCPAPWVNDEMQWRAFLGALEGEEDMTEAQVKALINKMLAETDAAVAAANGKTATWAAEAWNAAKVGGILDGTRPGAPLTRQEAAVVLYRLGLLGEGKK